jgi:hypothetical protein
MATLRFAWLGAFCLSLVAGACGGDESTPGSGSGGTTSGGGSGGSAGSGGSSGGVSGGGTAGLAGSAGVSGAGGVAGGGGAAGSGPIAPLGTVTDQGTTPCSNVQGINGLPQGTMTCRTLGVSCPGADEVTATVVVIEPSAALIGTIFLHSGGGGNSFLAQAAVASDYLTAGYRLVFVRWEAPSGWEDVGSGAKSIKVAACRPATVMKWAFDVPHGGHRDQAFCGQGQSGGSGVLGYALATYGMDGYLDYAMLTEGPPFGRMDCGCDPTPSGDCASPPALCPEMPSVSLGLPPGVGTWEGTVCSTSEPTSSELAKLLADSVASDPGDFDYPKTPVSDWFCAQNPNGTSGGGAFYLARVTPKPTVFCATNCSGEAIYNANAALGDGTLVSDAMLAEMTKSCVPRHQP